MELLTLSTSGVIRNPKHIMRRILLNYFKLNAKTSRLYRKRLYTINEALKDFKHDIESLEERVQMELKTIAMAYFDYAEITTTIVEIESSLYTISIGGVIQSGNITHQINELFKLAV